MWPKDTPRPDSNPFKVKYTIAKKDIPAFVNSLHELQEQYLESAMEASGYKEADAVIKRIMEMK